LGCDVFTLHTKHGSDIVAAYIPTRRHSDPTLLYSHGNAVDLGQMLPFYKYPPPAASLFEECRKTTFLSYITKITSQ